nr:MAG TPA: hypothetical protein [Caudoviricetes sp.]
MYYDSNSIVLCVQIYCTMITIDFYCNNLYNSKNSIIFAL